MAPRTIFDYDGESEHVNVSIDVIVDGDCRVLVPSKDEDNVLSQEIGYHLQWPRHLVIIDNEKDMKFQGEPIVPLMTPIQSSHVVLRCLLRQLDHIGSSIQINAPIDAFCKQLKCSI